MTMSPTVQKVAFGVGIVGLALAAAIAFFIPKASALTPLADIDSGDLIRGESWSSVYYMGADGLRYVFTTDKSFFTWYSDFSSVKWISDSDLQTLQIGGNVTYRPGVKMIKINTDPRTYAVAHGGVLRHVGSEAIAVSLYGANWNTKIDDVIDGFFTNYTIGEPIDEISDYLPADEMDISTDVNEDKNLQAPESIEIHASGYAPLDVTIDAGMSVRFTNTDSNPHTVTSDDLSWGSGTIQPGGSFIKKFNVSGTYSFFDSYDDGNSGAVYVE